MWLDLNRQTRAWASIACAAGMFCGLGPTQAQDRFAPPDDNQMTITQDAPAVRGTRHRAPRREASQRTDQYYVEFRSRYALSYGHTFLVYGRLNAKGEIGQVTADQVAGLHPAGEGPQLWSVGHVLPVPAETGPSDGDLEDEYISARFRVPLNEAQYRRVAAYIRNKQKTSPAWHAVLYNCNRWVGEVATFMGLQAPSNTLLYPADYIASLRSLNRGRVTESAFSAHRVQ
ncbi:hypothetical protein CYD53_106180 [Bosea psychrotolerans]|uniref:Uncharacterized protein n=2 Tax=Bosea psychrotolerans TaxID=1871628 RepID=A0A2S4MBM5_9HYPH|nr:hypothetical protein CYD53_106180 [Bosea psychrotolerans]